MTWQEKIQTIIISLVLATAIFDILLALTAIVYFLQ